MVKTYHIFIIFLLTCCTVVQLSAQEVTLQFSNECGQFGENVVVDVRVDGFADVTSFNFITKWDADVLKYESHGNIHPSLPAGNFGFGTPNITLKPGRINVSFSQADTIKYSLAPTDILFSVTLSVKNNSPGFSMVDTMDILPLNQFVLGTDNTKIKPKSRPGRVDVNVPCDATNTLSLGNAVGLPGGEVCIPLSGLKLADMGGFNGLRLNFDPSVITYNRIINKTLDQGGDPLVNADNAATGELVMLYSFVGPGGVGLTTDSTALFCICFTVVGDCDESIPVTLSETSTFGIFNSSGDVISYTLDDGQFDVNCCDASAVITDVTCPGGSNGSITLTPMGCTNISSYSWSGTNQTGNSISNLSGGSYDVTISYDGGSRVITGYTVDEPSVFEASNISFTKVVNGGDGGVSLTINGGTMPYSYLWSNGAVTQNLTNVNAGVYTLAVTDDENCTASFGPYSVASAPRITGVVTNVSCFGSNTGAVTLAITGGASPFSYDWSCVGTIDPNTGSISGLSGGNCSVTVTDASNCASTASFLIDAPTAALSSAGTINDDSDNDGNGSIDLAVAGGWGSYQFNWSDGSNTSYPNSNQLTGLFGGDYVVTITDGGNCSQVFGPFTVKGLRVFASNIDAVQCFGDNNGSIDIMVIGGSSTYTYDWSCTGNVDANGNISGLTSGPCTVTVTDVTQNSSTVTTFNVPGPTDALVVNVTLSQCTNGSNGQLLATPSGGVAPFSYEWNTNPAQVDAQATDLMAGDYNVIVTDSVGCQVMGFGTMNQCGGDQDCYTAMDVITPNEDGKNDFFIIDCVGNTRTTLRIFTRWGQEVITYDNYQNTWDGRDEGGNLVDEDTYMWVLEVYSATGNVALHKGAVSVLYALR